MNMTDVASLLFLRQRQRWVHASVRLQFERGQPADMSLALVSILSKLDEETRDRQLSSKRANDEHYIDYMVFCNIYPMLLRFCHGNTWHDTFV